MQTLSLTVAMRLAQGVIGAGCECGFAPLSVVVLDRGGRDLVVLRSDQAGFYRTEIARAKAMGCLGMGVGGRALAKRAGAAPSFYAALGMVVSGGVLPVGGGVLLRDDTGMLLGAVGVSGDTADNDEAAAITGIAAAGLIADCGD